MTAALEGSDWLAARPGHTLPPGKTRYPFYWRLGGPQGRSGRAENLVPTGIRSRTVETVVRISAVSEINLFCVYNISSLDHVVSQINPIYMLFTSHLLFCLHLSSSLIHSSVSRPTITYRERPQTGRSFSIMGRGFSSPLMPRERLWGSTKTQLYEE